ncbi:helix-turn-helix domain-containing protein [Cohnella fermenti]|uniref:helix-turn-helix domain-containing protein n=1 Tax=Cohnella fermenti TaxID=2565925 RepID=UPI0038B2B920
MSWIEQRFQQSFTEKGVSKLLKRLGFSYTKATYTLAHANPVEQKAFREITLPKLKEQIVEGQIDHFHRLRNWARHSSRSRRM